MENRVKGNRICARTTVRTIKTIRAKFRDRKPFETPQLRKNLLTPLGHHTMFELRRASR